MNDLDGATKEPKKFKSPGQLTLFDLAENHKQLKRAVSRLQNDVQSFMTKADKAEKRAFQMEQILKGGIKQAHRDYAALRPKLNVIKERVYQIILDRQGLTYFEILDEYVRRFRHKAHTDPRIRELFAEGRIIKVQGEDRLLHWWPKPKETSQ